MKHTRASNSANLIRFAPIEGPQVLTVAIKTANGTKVRRRIQPVMPIFFKSEKSEEQQWILRAFDLADGELHDFVLKDCDFTY